MPPETLRHFLDQLTGDELDRRFGPRIVQRGRDYFLHQHVAATIIGPGRVTAHVLGTSNYRTVITRTGGYLTPICDCPYEGECKHIVAVLLELRERITPERIALFDLPPEQDPFVQHLAELDADALRRELLVLAPEHYREVIRRRGTAGELRELSEQFREDVRAYADPEATLRVVAGYLLDLRRFVRAEAGPVNEALGEVLEELEQHFWLGD